MIVFWQEFGYSGRFCWISIRGYERSEIMKCLVGNTKQFPIVDDSQI